MYPRLRYYLLIGVCLSALLIPRGSYATPPESLVAIFMLAYDNRPDSPMNLTPYYEATLTSITNATVNQPALTAIVLTDLAGPQNTHIRVIQNGLVQTSIGLPDASGLLVSTLDEYDLTDGPSLGGFLIWAKQTYRAARYTLSYIGHGVPVMPDITLSTLGQAMPRGASPHLPPLPTRIGANAAATDHTLAITTTAYNALSPNDFAVALEMAAAIGPRFAVIDLLLCFAGSMEALYPLAPYADYLTASPNYAFFDPTMPGNAVRDLPAIMTSRAMAEHIVNQYHTQLPSSAHPRILSVIDARQLSPLKTTWDRLSHAIYTALIDPTQRGATRTAIVNAYRASRKYDLTYCDPHDWALDAPDGLVDMRTFAHALSQQFSTLHPLIATLAVEARDQLWTATGTTMVVVYRVARSGLPWVAPTSASWRFDGPDPMSMDDDAVGLSLYADFQGTSVNGVTELSWQAHWYHDDASQPDNPSPLAFFADDTQAYGWDEVFQEYWRDVPLQTTLCTPEVPSAQEDYSPHTDLAVSQLSPYGHVLAANEPVPLRVVLCATHAIQRSDLRFEVLSGSSVVFRETLVLTTIMSGYQRIDAQQRWQPTTPGVYTLRVIADRGDHVHEQNETNNILEQTLIVGTAQPQRPVVSATLDDEKDQLIHSATLAVSVVQHPDSGPAIDSLIVQAYQYEQTGNPPIHRPVLRTTATIKPVNGEPIPIGLTGLQPGALVVAVWGASSTGTSVFPAVMRTNYAPIPARITLDHPHTYRFQLERGQMRSFHADSIDGASAISAWEPVIATSPTQYAPADAFHSITYTPTPIAGEYIVQVDSLETSHYRFITRAAGAIAQPIEPIRREPPRPRFVEPVLVLPTNVTFLPTVQR